MKLLVISDIHSNIYALDAIWEQERRADVVLCAGDLVDYGTAPKEVISWIKRHNVRCVMGNHDQHLINTFANEDIGSIPPTEFKWVHDNCNKLSSEDISFLKTLPPILDLEYDGVRYTISHVYKGYEVIETLDAMDEYLLSMGLPPTSPHKELRMIFGHRHRRGVCYLSDNRVWLNPGSVSYRRPDDSDKSAHYIVVNNCEISLRSVEYDRSPLLLETQKYIARKGMMTTELQDACFFFGNSKTTRDCLAVKPT